MPRLPGKAKGNVRTSTGEPLPGVLVSDGRTVRHTDADGGFALEGPETGFVWITRPSGFTSGAWIHRLASPERAYDFTLEPVEQPVSFTFAQVTDPLTADATGLIATSGAGTVYRLDAATGEQLWRAELPDEALLPMGPYRKSGPVVVSGPEVTGRGILQGTCGGKIYQIDPTSGEADIVADVGAPVAAPLAPIGDDVIAAGADGVIHRLRIPTFHIK